MADSTHEMDRRSFVKAAGAAGAALAATGALAGAAGADEAGEPAEAVDAAAAPTHEIAQTLAADLVVVGAGGGGIAAAAQAVEDGLDVIVLEKLDFTGGTCARAHGIFAIESSIQKEAGVTTTREELFTKCMDYHHWLADTDVTMTLFRKSAETIDWMIDKGVVFNGVTRSGDSEQTWHNPDASVGDALAILEQYARDGGAQFLTSTPAVELLVDGGKVTGVVAHSLADDTYIEVDAPAVLMASGGFICNREMVEGYSPFKFDNFFNLGTEGRDGDGINMGIAAGAALHGMGALMLAGGTIESCTMADQIRMGFGRSPILWLNERGRRFADETTYGNFTFSGHIMCLQDQVYSLMDDAALQYFIDNGAAFNKGKFDNAREELAEYANTPEHPDVFQADTIEELAGLMGLDPATVVETIETYNGYCENGLDEDYGKTDWLWKLETPPFYAARLKSAVYTTVGGLKINGKAEVLDADKQPIPGLYACGGDAGGLYGDSYDVIICAGSQVGQTVNFGRIAADQAKEYIGK